nr:NAC family transcription factor [Larix gmelinii var. olgensis]
MGDLNCLPPGFRFHPTDEELVCYYLRGKVSESTSKSKSKSKSKTVYLNAITDIDLYKYDPSDLPAMSYLQGGDRQWFFFTEGNRKKYSNGSRKNRATEGGHWKTTCKDRPVLSESSLVGMKKTLVFLRGRSPHAVRTNWMMYEYRLVNDEDGESSRSEKDRFVLCRVFLKSGSGAKTGEQHGALFSREDSRSTDNQSALVMEDRQYGDIMLSPTGEAEAEERNSPLGPLTAAPEENIILSDEDISNFLLECLNETDNEQTARDLLQIPVGVDEWSSLIDEPFAEMQGIGPFNDVAGNLIRNDTQQQNIADKNLHTERDVHRVESMHGADTVEQSNFEALLSPAYLGGDFLELNDLISPLESDYFL